MINPERIRRDAQAAALTVARSPWMMHGVAGFGFLISCYVAVIGVQAQIGWQSALAIAGSVALIAATIGTELAALRLPVHAEARFREAGVYPKVKGLMVIAGFLILEAWNVTAVHFGAVEISQQGIRDLRAPLEKTLSEAKGEETAARETYDTFKREADTAAATWAIAASDAAAQVQNGYLTNGSKLLSSADAASTARSEKLATLSGDLAKKTAARETAAHALDRAPTSRPDSELWGFALLLVLIKGALVWFATGNERKAPKHAADAPALLPQQMTVDELSRFIAIRKSEAATAEHERRRRLKIANATRGPYRYVGAPC